MDTIISGLKSTDVSEQLYSVTQLREHLETGNPINTDVIPVLTDLLNSENDKVGEQAALSLGLIVADSRKQKNSVFKISVLKPFLQHLTKSLSSTDSTRVRLAARLLQDVFKSKPKLPSEITDPIIPVLINVLQSKDEETIEHICWALSCMTSKMSDTQLYSLVESGACKPLVELLSKSSVNIQKPLLKTLGDVLTGECSAQMILDLGYVKCISNLLQDTSTDSAILREACWTLSNITAENRECSQSVIDEGIIPVLLQMLPTAKREIKQEIVWVLGNITSRGTPAQIGYLADVGCIKPLCDLLALTDETVLSVTLEALENIVKAGPKTHDAVAAQATVMDHLKELQKHPSPKVSEGAEKLLEALGVEISTKKESTVGGKFKPGPPLLHRD